MSGSKWDGVMARLMNDPMAVALLDNFWMQESTLRRYAHRNGRRYYVLTIPDTYPTRS